MSLGLWFMKKIREIINDSRKLFDQTCEPWATYINAYIPLCMTPGTVQAWDPSPSTPTFFST